MDIKKIQIINELISKQRTGKPKEFAAKIGLSERMLYNYLKFLKTSMQAPITYNRLKQTYLYQEPGFLCINIYQLE